jgi:NADPH:quinone reductase-like Zn-dependent oxidoreductase
MRAYSVPKGCKGIDELRLVERPDPQPGPGQVLIRVRAASLNYRDHQIITGNYFGGAASRDVIPLSDGAGEVTAVGPGVTRFKPGDRVAGVFSQVPPQGPPSGQRVPLGSPLDGMLVEQIVLYEDGVVSVPENLSFEQAASLPCAAVTAWNALMVAGKPIKPGDTVLVLGTGGVSTFGLLFAKVAGARVLATSSSDEKLERVKALGASDGINYKRTPEWDKEVLKLTGGRGADCVVEVGGAGTLARSFQALAPGGKVALIGVLTGPGGDTNPHALMLKGGSLHGIFVGTREIFEEMNRAIEVAKIEPIIDKVFPFEEAAAAYRHQASRNFVGKIVITI